MQPQCEGTLSSGASLTVKQGTHSPAVQVTHSALNPTNSLSARLPEKAPQPPATRGWAALHRCHTHRCCAGGCRRAPHAAADGCRCNSRPVRRSAQHAFHLALGVEGAACGAGGAPTAPAPGAAAAAMRAEAMLGARSRCSNCIDGYKGGMVWLPGWDLGAPAATAV